MDPPGPGSKTRPEPGASSVSARSDLSKGEPPNFREPRPEGHSPDNTDPPGPGSKTRPEPGPSSVSARSDFSKGEPPNFREPRPEDHSTDNVASPGFSLRSKPRPKPGASSESVRSDLSKGEPPNFREPRPEGHREPGSQEQLDDIFTRLEEDLLVFVKEQLQRLRRLLESENPQRISESEEEEERSSREAVLDIALDFLRRRMKQEQLAERLRNRSSAGVCRDELKDCLQQRFSTVFEGVAKAGNPAPLNQIYTELSITEGGASEVNQEHEVRHIENISRKPSQGETRIICEDLFKGAKHRRQPIRAEMTEEGPIRAEVTEEGPIRAEVTEEGPIRAEVTEEGPIRAELTIKTDVMKRLPIRTVLMKGVAGVGKTVLTQKFSLDWSEDKTNQDIQLLFPFTFRELNVLKDRSFSLVELLHHCFRLTKELSSLQNIKVLFILDGLDECRLPLDFRRTRVITDPTESASVEELLVNLIRGDLLPSSHLWITTRPAAANQIPAECVSMVTEVQGFKDLQKEQYFMKRFKDVKQATNTIKHIKSIRSLFIMCYIPIFCWILSTVLLHLMKTRERGELPKTLTQMYVHFLVVQAKVKNIKYDESSGADLHWTPETRAMVWSLGKLAFEQLLKGNLIFYEVDVIECGLDAADIARYSGVFTEVFREEHGLYQDKVYCFIHLTVQEFLAALFVHQTFFSSGVNLLSPEASSESPESFYRSAVDLALQSPNGHLDLFLRFLLGLSLPTNQRLLSGLLTQTGSDSTNQETVKYIKQRLNEEGLSAERSLNLFHCLNELNDHSLLEKIQGVMRERHLLKLSSPAQWSAVSFLLLSSDSDLEEFDLRKYQASDTALLGLLPIVKASTKAILSVCNLTENICAPLASVLVSSSLTLLDLSNNDLLDSGVELLCSGLKKSAPCRLETLRLSGCLVSERGGASLAAALSSAPSALRELDLSYNDPGASAELLTALRKPHGPLDSLWLDPAGEQWMVPGLRKYSREFFLDINTAQKYVHLSEDKRTVRGVWEHEEGSECPYPDHEDRFVEQKQVLSCTGLRGRCYWEVEWIGGWGEVDVAVSSRGIKRRGKESRFGDNDQSWSLRIFTRGCSVFHNNRETRLSSPFRESYSGTVSVFLDPEAGALTFYDVLADGRLSHLHTFTSFFFSEPLFPGFSLSQGASVSVVDLRRAPPAEPL